MLTSSYLNKFAYVSREFGSQAIYLFRIIRSYACTNSRFLQCNRPSCPQRCFGRQYLG